MRIAIPTEKGEVFQHFGKSVEFTLFDIENHIVQDTKNLDTSDSGHGALADKLKENDVHMVICGGIGEGALKALAQSGIEVIGGVKGIAKEMIIKYLSGENIGDPDFLCNHHDKNHEHHH